MAGLISLGALVHDVIASGARHHSMLLVSSHTWLCYSLICPVNTRNLKHAQSRVDIIGTARNDQSPCQY